MKGRWWRWLSALLAALCGLAFGWVAGTGVARAEVFGGVRTATVVTLVDAPRVAQIRADNHPRRRFQPSSASALR